MLLLSNALKKLGFLAFCLLFVLALSLALTGEAEAKSKSRSKKKSRARPAAARVAPVSRSTAKYADIIIDAETGRILMETDSEKRRHPASLTKMMTLYLTFQAIESGVVRLDTPLPVSANAAAQAPTKLGLRPGQTLRVYDAVMGLVTESANDAAVVLAEGLGGTVDRFVVLMNQQARTLGLRGTVFQNPSGLPDPDQVTTAQDMAVLAMALIAHYPGFYPYFSRQSFTYAGRVHHNHNHLMERYEGMDGIKTGYVRASGFNLVASVQRGNTRLIGVVFGGTSAPRRDRQMEGLLDNAFASLSRGTARAAPGKTLPFPSKVAAAFPSRTARQPDRRAPPPAPSGEAPEPQHAQEESPQDLGGWGIQVGAFSDVGSAQQALQVLARQSSPLLDQAEQSLQKVTMTDGSAMFRARFTGLSQRAARSACSHLIQRGQGCLVISGP